MLRSLWIASFAFLVSTCARPAFAEELVFANDATPYCPYTTCNNGKQGYVIDVLVAIYEDYGYKVTIKDLPWNRAIAMVNAGSTNGIVGITKDVLPNLVYPHSEIARYTPAVFSLKEKAWRFDGIASLKKVRLGMVKNYGNGEGNPELEKYLDGQPANVTYIAADDAISHLFLMIEADHIDAMIEDLMVGNYYLRLSGKKKIFNATPIQQSNLFGYIGFNPSDGKSRHLAALFDTGLAKLRRSGKLKTILAAYHLSDWQG
jgi:polar amino acid transport system substrate-binding protein